MDNRAAPPEKINETPSGREREDNIFREFIFRALIRQSVYHKTTSRSHASKTKSNAFCAHSGGKRRPARQLSIVCIGMRANRANAESVRRGNFRNLLKSVIIKRASLYIWIQTISSMENPAGIIPRLRSSQTPRR